MRVLFSVLVLCTALSAQATHRNWDVIDPIGDELLGTLIVTPPSTANVPAKFIMKHSLNISGVTSKSVETDKPARVLGGDYCLHLEVAGRGRMSSLCDVKVVKKQTTTIPLSAVRLDWDRSKFEVEVGPRPNLIVRGDRKMNQAMEAADLWMGVEASMYTPVLDTRIEASIAEFAVFKPQTVSVSQGQVEAHALSFHDHRSSVEVIWPTRAFPDPTTCAPQAYLTHRKPAYGGVIYMPGDVLYRGVWDRMSKTYISDSVRLASGASSRVRFFPSKDGFTPLEYAFVVNNMVVPLTNATPTISVIRVKRIDVNDVLVTRENGSTYYAKGTYKVFRKGAVTGEYVPVVIALGESGLCSRFIAQDEFPTKTGIDVLPAEYKVTVSYKTEEGSDSKDYFIDLR